MGPFNLSNYWRKWHLSLAIGSHQEIADQTWTEEEGRAVQIIVNEDIVSKYEQTTLEMNVGDLLILVQNYS